MSFSIQLLCFRASDPTPALKIPLPWWRHRELLRQYRFTRKTDSGYLDYYLEVSPETLGQLHREQLKYLEEGSYASPQWQAQLVPVREQVEEVLQNPFEYSLLQVHVFEWESGLG